MISTKNIKLSSSRKVTSINSLSDEALEELKKGQQKIVDELRAKLERHQKTSGYPIALAAGSIIITALAVAANKGVIANPGSLRIATVIEGLAFGLTAMNRYLGGSILQRKYDKEIRELEDIEVEIRKRRIKEQYEKTMVVAKEALGELLIELHSVEHNERREQLVNQEINECLKAGANKEIMMMPGIRQILDVALRPRNIVDDRKFINDENTPKVYPDGMIMFLTCLNGINPNVVKKLTIYKIDYCENRDEEHYVEVKFGMLRIILNKDGNITYVKAVIDDDDYHDEITIPFDELETKEYKNITAAMEALRQMEQASNNNPKIPTISFDQIKKAELLNHGDDSQANPVIDGEELVARSFGK